MFFDFQQGQNGNNLKTDVRQILALLKRNIIRHSRSFSTIIEIILSFLVPFFLVIIFNLHSIDIPEDKDPRLTTTKEIKELTNYFDLVNESIFVVCPQNSVTIGLTKKMFAKYMSAYNIKIIFVNKTADISKEIYKYYLNGIGIEWVNSGDADAMTNPNINVYYQDFGYNFPSQDVYRILRKAIGKTTGCSSIANFRVNKALMAHPHLKLPQNLRFSLMAFCCWPCILVTLHIFQDLIDDRENGVHELMKVMRCKERNIWISSFISGFVLSAISYAFFCFVITNTSLFCDIYWSVMFTVCILFSVAHIIVMFVLISVIKNSNRAKLLPILDAIIIMFMDFFNMSITFKIEKTKSKTLQKIISFIPISSFQISFALFYCYASHIGGPLDWSKITLYFEKMRLSLYLKLLIIWTMIYLIIFVVIKIHESMQYGSKKYQKYCVNPKSNSMIRVENLKKTYKGIIKDTKVLDNVNFEIKKGEIVVVIGPNGAGKSTLINSMSGVIPADGGVISIMGGESIDNFRIMHEFMGICLQDNVFDKKLTVIENIRFFAALKGVCDKELEYFINNKCEMMELTKSFGQIAGSVSGGQKRKLSIALSILGQPPIILMDEPIAGVDTVSRTKIWKTIGSLNNSSVLVTCHSLEEASSVASRIMIIYDGHIPYFGTIENLRAKCNCGYLLTCSMKDENDEKNGLKHIIDFAYSNFPDIYMSGDSIYIPDSERIDEFLELLDDNLDRLGIKSYSFVSEPLEEVVLNMIRDGMSFD